MVLFCLVIVLVISMSSCSFSPTSSAGRIGYKWSCLYNDSLFLFEKGIPLITPNRKQTCFIVLSKDSSDVELFLPEDTVEVFRFAPDNRKWIGNNKEIVFENGLWNVRKQDGKVIYLQPITECDPALGALEVNTYQGSFPDDGGESTRYVLTVRNQIHNGDGVFQLLRLKDGDKDSANVDFGIRYMLRGMQGNDDAVVWQCRSNSGQIFNFLYFNDKTLILLNSDMQFMDTLSVHRLNLTEK